MKVIDSGMPEEAYWKSLFTIPAIVGWLEIERLHDPIVEIGCGYGTFTIPIAKKARNAVYTYDIDSLMIAVARQNAHAAGVTNVIFEERDILERQTGLDAESVGMVTLFNILHFDQRRAMLEEAARILKPSGVAAIIHWRKDIETPRGPLVSTRPDQEIILDAIKGLDLHFNGNSKILAPYHWGIQLIKGTST
jgi:ubiquinone/menaquinone biosynthesis C-methylase UbiE